MEGCPAEPEARWTRQPIPPKVVGEVKKQLFEWRLGTSFSDEDIEHFFGREFLSKFNVIEMLGVPGSYGAVFKCEREDGVLFAVKVISIEHHKKIAYGHHGDPHLAQLETE